jgi:sialic acid synthase SpsE
MNVQIGPYQVGPGHRPLVIAEAGINHNGDMAKARDLVVAAAEAGAHIVKFQTHLPDQEMLKDGFSADYIGESFYDLLVRCVLREQDHEELMQFAQEQGILFLSTPFSREAADLLERLGVVAFKTGSGELTNLPLQEHIARKGKPMIISTGMSTLEEVQKTVEAVRPINPGIVLMHCTSTYPTRYEDVRLLGIQQLRMRFDLLTGLSDHSPGVATSLGAVALGAVLLEKHFTLDRSWPGPDQAGSIEPDELARLVRESEQIWLALRERHEVLPDEVPVQQMARESVVTVQSIPLGTQITSDMVWVKRPGTGIPASQLETVIGRVTKRDLPSDHLVSWEDLEEGKP